MQFPTESHRLLAAITKVIIGLLVEQYSAGAQYLMVFESNSGELCPREFRAFVLPYLRQIANAVRDARRCSPCWLPLLPQLSAASSPPHDHCLV